MALNESKGGSWGVRLHLLVRLLGLTGFVAAVGGLVIALVANLRPEVFLPALRGESTDPVAVTAAWLLAAGGGVFLLMLLVELLVALRMVAGRRSLFGTNAALQVAVAAALLIGVNVYSFQHYVRQDWTPEPKKFTLPETVRDDLSQLRGTGGKTT